MKLCIKITEIFGTNLRSNLTLGDVEAYCILHDYAFWSFVEFVVYKFLKRFNLHFQKVVRMSDLIPEKLQTPILLVKVSRKVTLVI